VKRLLLSVGLAVFMGVSAFAGEAAPAKEESGEAKEPGAAAVEKLRELLQQRKTEEALKAGQEALKTLPVEGEKRLDVTLLTWVAARALYMMEGTHEETFVSLMDGMATRYKGAEDRRVLPAFISGYLLAGRSGKARSLAASLLERVPAPDETALEKWKAENPGKPHPDEQLREYLKFQQKLLAGPEFKLTDLEGKPVSLADYKGKVLLLDFWATWCGPCKAELPNLLALYKSSHEKGFEILGLSLDRSEAALKGFVEENGIAWPNVYLGADQAVAEAYGVSAIPTQFLFGRAGKLRYAGLRGEMVNRAVAKLLAEKAPAREAPEAAEKGAEPAK
jgi:thiol-disulfide isomerase/thioredoxin